jgi:hypothetical protein
MPNTHKTDHSPGGTGQDIRSITDSEAQGDHHDASERHIKQHRAYDRSRESAGSISRLFGPEDTDGGSIHVFDKSIVCGVSHMHRAIIPHQHRHRREQTNHRRKTRRRPATIVRELQQNNVSAAAWRHGPENADDGGPAADVEDEEAGLCDPLVLSRRKYLLCLPM